MESTRTQRRSSRSIIAVVVMATALALGGIAGSPAAPVGAASAPVEATVCGSDGAALVRLYRAYFDRAPDRPGLVYWGEQYRHSNLESVAAWMADSEEYQQRWRNSSDSHYVATLLYRNLLGREPEKAGLDYWTGLLSSVSRAKQVVHWVQQPELVSNHPVTEPAECRREGMVFRSIPGGRAVDVDYSRVDLKTSARRCSVASINANWLNLSTGAPIGIGVIDNVAVPGGVDGHDRGVFGERYRPNGPIAEFTYEWDNAHMNANLATKGKHVLEIERDWQLDGHSTPDGYRWAVSGIVMLIKGQQTVTQQQINANPYTMLTHGHSFAAFKAPSTVTFGSTTGMSAPQLMDWLIGQGYTDMVKLDGGGSVEYNEYGRTLVAGTSRAIPVWLGVGC